MGDEDRLAEILFDWRERQDRGEYVDPEDVVRAHPDLAEKLRARFVALAAVEDALGESVALRPDDPGRIGTTLSEQS